MEMERVWLPVAHDRDGDDQQHRDDNRRDDDRIQFHLVLPLVVHRADQPLAITELNLRWEAKRQVRTLITTHAKQGILGTTKVASYFLPYSH